MIYEIKGISPKIGENNYIAPNSTLIGDVVTAKDVSIWFNAVLRGDMSHIKIGEGSNIQDNCTIHGDTDYPVNIGKNVTIGHNCVIHGCKIGDNCVIGMGSIILNGSVIPDNTLIAGGSVITPKLILNGGELVGGVPAKIIRNLTPENIDYLKYAANVYIDDIDIYTKTLKNVK